MPFFNFVSILVFLRIKALKERQRENIENEITVFPERTLPTPDQDAPIKVLNIIYCVD